MSARSWRELFSDPAIRSKLLAAARDCMRDGCACGPDGEAVDDPAFCDCPANRMTPLEFGEWIEREAFISERGAGVRRLDHREHMSDRAVERHARAARMECATA